MKHKRLKNYLKLGILLLGIPLIIYSCQKDDDFKDVEQQIAKSNHKIKATILNGNVVLKQNTLLKKQIKKITSPKKEFFENTIHSNSYGFSIDTSRIQIIETDFYKSYTFLVNRESQNENILEKENKSESIFENVWATKKNSIPRLSDLTYQINMLTDRIYSVTLNAEGCGAYCEYFSYSYNYDLSNGNKILLDSIFSQKGKAEMLNYLSNKKRKIIESYVLELKKEEIQEEKSNKRNDSILDA